MVPVCGSLFVFPTQTREVVAPRPEICPPNAAHSWRSWRRGLFPTRGIRVRRSVNRDASSLFHTNRSGARSWLCARAAVSCVSACGCVRKGHLPAPPAPKKGRAPPGATDTDLNLLLLRSQDTAILRWVKVLSRSLPPNWTFSTTPYFHLVLCRFVEEAVSENAKSTISTPSMNP